MINIVQKAPRLAEDERWEKQVIDLLRRRESVFCPTVDAVDKIDLLL